MRQTRERRQCAVDERGRLVFGRWPLFCATIEVHVKSDPTPITPDEVNCDGGLAGIGDWCPRFSRSALTYYPDYLSLTRPILVRLLPFILDDTANQPSPCASLLSCSKQENPETMSVFSVNRLMVRQSLNLRIL